MSQDLTISLPVSSQVHDVDAVLRIGQREIFWHPRHLRPSRYAAHLPFLFWLMADLRPRRCITLGLETGVAHFALCQAVDKLGLETRCDGLDAAPAPALRDYNAELYGRFSQLHPQDDPGPFLAQGGTDLLLVDQPVTAGLLGRLAADWAGHLAQPGLIVLAGVQEAAGCPEAAALLQSLRDRYRHVQIDHDGGVLALATGGQGDSGTVLRRFGALAALPRSASGYPAVRQVFRRLGQMNTAVLDARQVAAPARRQDEALRLARATQAGLIGQLAARDRRLAELTQEQQTGQEARAGLEARLERHQAEINSLIARLEARDAPERARPAAPPEMAPERVLAADPKTVQEALAAAEIETILRLGERDSRISELATRLEQAERAREELVARNRQTHREVELLSLRLQAEITAREAAEQALEALRAPQG
ncbi:MAG: hypothetical protein ACK4GW_10620 [Pseudorhodobacter sp.]